MEAGVPRRGPGLRHARGDRRPDGLDLLDRPQLHPSGRVGLESQVHLEGEVAVAERQVDRGVGPRLAGLAQDVKDEALLGAGQVQVLGLLGRLDPVERERPPVGELLFPAGGQALHAGAHREAEAHHVVGDLEGDDGLPVVVELETPDLHRRGDAVPVGRLDRQHRLLEELEAHGSSVEAERGAEQHLRLGAPEQRLAVDVQPRGERVALRAVVEALERRERAVAQQDRLPPRALGEGDRDRAVLVGRVLAAAHPDRGVLERDEVLVEETSE